MTSAKETHKTVECPTCKKQAIWGPENPWRPFCSERCKLIDLGEWFEERHRIPDRSPPEDQE
ncbi:MAG: DNA gyrase inhibitor YacG [Thiogranum sp.]|nr:DNA gyrase inhibitor YacG [Thiogranum sp.]